MTMFFFKKTFKSMLKLLLSKINKGMLYSWKISFCLFLVSGLVSISVCRKDSPKYAILKPRLELASKKISNAKLLDFYLRKMQFCKDQADLLKVKLKSAIGQSWYDQNAVFKIQHVNYGGMKYISKVNFTGFGKSVKIVFADNTAKVVSVQNSVAPSVLKGLINSNNLRGSFSNNEVPLTLRQAALKFIQGSGLNLSKGEKFSCVYNPSDSKVIAVFTSHPSKGSRAAVLYKTNSGSKILSKDGSALVADRVAFKMPVKGRLSSRFGKRQDPFSKKIRFHSGIDLAAPKGTPVYPAANGVVSYMGYYGAYGNCMILKHGRITTLYAHLSAFEKGVKVGSRVTSLKPIARVGSTGRSTGNHLHFEVWNGSVKVDPLLFRKEVRYVLEGVERSKFLKYKEELSSFANSIL